MSSTSTSSTAPPAITTATMASDFPIGIVGTYTLRSNSASAATSASNDASSPITHTFTLTAENAQPLVTALVTSSSSTSTTSVDKPQRLTANTVANHPSAIARTCATDTTLSALVSLIRQAGVESDKYLTAQIDAEEANRPKTSSNQSAASNLNNGSGKKKQQKRKNNADGDEAEEGEETHEEEDA